MPKDLPLFYWQAKKFENFGDYCSLKLIERIVNTPVRVFKKNTKKNAKQELKLLAIGSIFSFANNNDIVWGSGINGKLDRSHYTFTHLDIRAIRGPLSRQYLIDNFNISCPEIYGDPALLFPYFFPEFKRKEAPSQKYLIIPHYSEEHLFPKELFGSSVAYPSEPWDQIIEKILDSEFVISSSLHGIIIAEAYHIPARQLRVTSNESLFKYLDYYFGTHRPYFKYATSVEEALKMGGEPPFECDLEMLYQAFPFEFWPNTTFKSSLKDNYEQPNT